MAETEGNLLVKVFQGAGFDEFRSDCSARFMQCRRPQAEGFARPQQRGLPARRRMRRPVLNELKAGSRFAPRDVALLDLAA